MAKLTDKLERIFGYRIATTDEIPTYIKRLSEMGKLDEPKKIALFTLILERIVTLEEAIISYDMLIEDMKNKIIEQKEDMGVLSGKIDKMKMSVSGKKEPPAPAKTKEK